jgi:sec-independent protein translocase protein TatC
MAGDHERPDEAEGGPVKTFLEHLEDFRWVLIKSLTALAVAMLLCLIAGNYVVQIIKWPLKNASMDYPVTVWNHLLGWALPLNPSKISHLGPNQIVAVNFGTNHLGEFQLTPEQQRSMNFGTNRFVSVQLEPLTIGTNHVLGWRAVPDPQAAAEAQRLQINLINLGPVEGFYIAFQVALYGGLLLASPFISYFVASFVFPALKMRERKYIYRGLFFGVGLFLFGVAFCYFILMPVALAASQMYSQWLGFGALQWRAGDYISFVCKFMLGMGLGFELPVVILTLVKIGVLDYRTLRGMWRYMVVIVLVLGALLTTPEIVTQILMAVPLYMLYEVTVWIAWYWDRQEKKRARESETVLRS